MIDFQETGAAHSRSNAAAYYVLPSMNQWVYLLSQSGKHQVLL
jgi:hypothetical protein